MEQDITQRKLPPVCFIRMINSFRYSLLWLNKRLFPANIVIYEHFQFFWLLPCLRVAAELNIAGIIDEKPMSVNELAEATGSNPENLSRLIRALSSQGIFKQKKGSIYNTNFSRSLMDGKGSLRYLIMQHLGTLNWTVFNELSYSIRSGQDAFSKVYGERIYDFLSRNPREYELFDRSMTNLTELAIEPILSVYNFSPFTILADIGGGEGLLLSSVLFKYPKLTGVLFDTPEGLTNSNKIIEKYGVADRIKRVTGNFFDSAPKGADAYLLKNVLHNWSDEESIKILSNVSSVLPDHGKILILEMVLKEDNRPSFGKLIDIQMMVFMQAGKERTLKEYKFLLKSAGLKINRIIATISPLSIIEAVKVI